jgi:hypothetical protein
MSRSVTKIVLVYLSLKRAAIPITLRKVTSVGCGPRPTVLISGGVNRRANVARELTGQGQGMQMALLRCASVGRIRREDKAGGQGGRTGGRIRREAGWLFFQAA